MNEPHTRPDDRRTALAEHLRPELFRALCDSNRLTLVARLATASRPLTVTEASTCCGVHLSGVSRHLSMLRDAGVLKATKQGREVRYELDCDALAGALRELADALDACRAVCCAQTEETGT
ncbi:MAG TPA: metalloregulator ArsR/SmtB family transcription factor [Thermoanaerobaculia bacterium]|nr:metalloregulator ArsR/SmtB family transcription factor [Thermoanaerobaculia bacterium]